MSALREAGYAAPFLTVEQGVSTYCTQLLADLAPAPDPRAPALLRKPLDRSM